MRIRIFSSTWVWMVSFLLVILNACTVSQTAVNKAVPPEKQLVLPEVCDNIPATISRIQVAPEQDLAGYQLLQLSFLYSHRTNPKPDYDKAFELLNRYTAITPKQGQFELATYIISLLEKMKKQEQVIAAERLALKKAITGKKMLVEENKDLQKKITSLKRLDIRLEKQRLGVE